MKKGLSLVLCVLMVFAVMFTFTGCGEQDKFVGTWETTVDLTDIIKQELEAEEEMAEYVKIKDFSVLVITTYDEDGTYKMTVDEESVKTSFDGVREDLAAGLEKYFEEMLVANGLDMTVEALLASTGYTMEDLIEEALSEEMVDSMVEEMSAEGKYEVKDGKLFMSDGLDKEIDEEEYETYKIDDKELVLLEGFGGDEDDDSNLYPITFKKVG